MLQIIVYVFWYIAGVQGNSTNCKCIFVKIHILPPLNLQLLSTLGFVDFSEVVSFTSRGFSFYAHDMLWKIVLQFLTETTFECATLNKFVSEKFTKIGT